MLSELLWCSVLSRFGWVVRLVTAPNVPEESFLASFFADPARISYCLRIFAWLFHPTIFLDRSICEVSSNSLLK